MRDDLKEILMDRVQNPEEPRFSLPSIPARIPPAWQRFVTSLKMQRAYANNWIPNPILLRILGGRSSSSSR